MILRNSAAAQQDIDEIWSYVAQDNPRAANRLIDRLTEAAQRLTAFPGMGLARDDLASGMRALRVDNYIIFYRARPDGLVVARVLHARLDVTASQF